MDHITARVADDLESLASSLLLPAWREEVAADNSDPEHLVGGCNLVMEREMGERLQSVLSAPILSAQKLEQDRSLLRTVSSAPWLWIINPLDPIRVFVEGSDTFSTSVCLLRHGQPTRSWIFFPARRLFILSSSEGTFLDGIRAQVRPAPMWWRVTVQDEHFSAGLKEMIRRSKAPNFDVRPVGHTSLSLLRLLDASADAHLTSVITPWTSAATAFSWQQAGGVVKRIDGARWHPLDTQGAILFAPDIPSFDDLHQRLLQRKSGPVASSIGTV